MQLLDFDWPANILAGLNFRAQENRLCHQTVFALSARARLGTRLAQDLAARSHIVFHTRLIYKRPKMMTLEREFLNLVPEKISG